MRYINLIVTQQNTDAAECTHILMLIYIVDYLRSLWLDFPFTFAKQQLAQKCTAKLPYSHQLIESIWIATEFTYRIRKLEILPKKKLRKKMNDVVSRCYPIY